MILRLQLSDELLIRHEGGGMKGTLHDPNTPVGKFRGGFAVLSSVSSSPGLRSGQLLSVPRGKQSSLSRLGYYNVST